METKEILENHEKRIRELENRFSKTLNKSGSVLENNFSFSDKSKNHNELLEQLLKSDFCHSKNGLSFEEVLEIFRVNGRPVVPKKLRDLLSTWKKRKKIEAIKEGGVLRYFWIGNG